MEGGREGEMEGGMAGMRRRKMIEGGEGTKGGKEGGG